MALFSDIDWAILLIVGGFLLFGRENQAILRTLGRYYGRAMRLKQELLDEVGRAADLPKGSGGRPPSIREAILGIESPIASTPAIPAAVARAPTPAFDGWASTTAPRVWSIATPAVDLEPGRRP
ncbi:MAG TPA: hypothetical protein VGV64_04820 [Thermoplasmata archaeon]|nr:hypothetical protein [Thermoplasmata archaeon]HEV2429153.1 hypothetical protein [Thermoplasmata archaeon]